MAQRITLTLLVLFFGSVAHRTVASHIVGGNIQLSGSAGKYNLSLHLFTDDVNSRAGDIKATVKLAIYRKRDNLKMGEFELPLTSQAPLPFSNQVCAQLRPLKLREVNYSQAIQLDPDRFTDAGGYYIVHGVCCRSASVDNIAQADQSGMVFHLEFPPLKTVADSSPIFSAPTGEYACKGQPFTFSFKATDPDGDELRYSLVTPYKGFTNQGIAFDNSPSTAYPTVQWQNGFSATNAVPGTPALQIDANGQLTVTASQVGLFAFTVQCEEWRDGKRIGSVRRDFQLAVVDCPPNTPPTPVISLAQAPQTAKITNGANGNLSSVTVCQGQTVTLKTDFSGDFTYQWQRDGLDLANDTTGTLLVKESGSYSVIKKYRNTCGKPSPAQTNVTVSIASAAAFPISAAGPTAFCAGQSVTLKATEGASAYVWLKNNQPVTNASGTTYQATESGEYRLQATSAITGCTTTSDSILVRANSKPDATILPVSSPKTCAGDSIQLRVATTVPSYRYQWTLAGAALSQATSATLTATQSGPYTVTVTDINQCQATSAVTTLEFQSGLTVTMEPLPAVCENDAQRVPLRATPAGGTFAGLGKAAGAVTNSEFDPAKAGPGLYVLTYTVTQAGGTCPGVAQQTILVNPAPVITVPDVTVRKGGEVTLNEKGPDTFQYTWSPADGLNNATAAHPVARPDATTTYQLTVINAQGCRFTTQVTVAVTTILFVPDVFTPNNDGQNDTWDIRGIADYPDCTVEVYNRWGNCVFASRGYGQPWDGRREGEELPPALYQYVIKPGGSQPSRSGSVLIVR